ncbi:MAG: hypothetical protein AAGI06_09500 [Pseudomonadota bacterium]
MDTKSKEAPEASERNWPNGVAKRDELDAALEAGEASGVSDRTTQEIFDGVISRLKNG